MQIDLQKVENASVLLPPKAPRAHSFKEYSWESVILPPLPPFRGFILGAIIESNEAYTVYDATHEFYGNCIVKAYNPEFDFAAQYELYFFRHLRSHPHIITILNAWEFNKINYIAMEKPDGSLCDLGKMPQEQIVLALRHITTALYYLYQKQVVHFDLKPKNIVYMTKPDGSRVYKLTELGLAEPFRIVYSSEFQCDIANGAVEKTSLWYRSYELLLLNDDPITEKADVWSLGCILYEMMTGTPLFPELSQCTGSFEHRRIIKKGLDQLHPKNPFLQLVRDCLNIVVSNRLSIIDVLKRVWNK
jgi:serine/threonine protein kinase